MGPLFAVVFSSGLLAQTSHSSVLMNQEEWGQLIADFKNENFNEPEIKKIAEKLDPAALAYQMKAQGQQSMKSSFLSPGKRMASLPVTPESVKYGLMAWALYSAISGTEGDDEAKFKFGWAFNAFLLKRFGKFALMPELGLMQAPFALERTGNAGNMSIISNTKVSVLYTYFIISGYGKQRRS
jgi:hypothetical protein